MASLNLRSRFGLFVSGLNIPFPGNGDCGSKRPNSTANRRTVTIRSRLPPCAPLLPLVSSATRRLLNLTRIQSGRPSIHPAFLGYDVERLMKSVVNDAPRPRARLRGKASLDRPRAAGWRRSTSAYRRRPVQRKAGRMDLLRPLGPRA